LYYGHIAEDEGAAAVEAADSIITIEPLIPLSIATQASERDPLILGNVLVDEGSENEKAKIDHGNNNDTNKTNT
jgi:hypothetical protein